MAELHIIEQIKNQLTEFEPEVKVKTVGTVIKVADGIVYLTGLREAMYGEIIKFESQALGYALNLEEDLVGVILLSGEDNVHAGEMARLTGEVLSVPVGENFFGRVVNALGKPIDGRGPIISTKKLPIERPAPGIMDRESVSEPLHTGIKAIDSLVPIGRGQRELIIGDRQTGKTALAIDTIINQKDSDVICIYVAIGQKESKVARIVDQLQQFEVMSHTIVVSASASDPAAMWYIAPYTGCVLGEYFRDSGRHVLVIYDDLSKHAWAYRQISLLLRRPPGREAYPGDVFYLHSRLLERAAKLNKKLQGGSLTAIPIVETQAGDISAYIPTNIISITDGQIFLESDLFYAGIRPALNVGLSVSRVGGAAQIKAMKRVVGKLRLDMAQFRELQAFAQFTSDLDDMTRMQIERGKRIIEILKQEQYVPLPIEEQVVVLYTAINGYLDDIAVEVVCNFEDRLMSQMRQVHGKLLKKIKKEGVLTLEIENELRKTIETIKDSWNI